MIPQGVRESPTRKLTIKAQLWLPPNVTVFFIPGNQTDMISGIQLKLDNIPSQATITALFQTVQCKLSINFRVFAASILLFLLLSLFSSYFLLHHISSDFFRACISLRLVLGNMFQQIGHRLRVRRSDLYTQLRHWLAVCPLLLCVSVSLSKLRTVILTLFVKHFDSYRWKLHKYKILPLIIFYSVSSLLSVSDYFPLQTNLFQDVFISAVVSVPLYIFLLVVFSLSQTLTTVLSPLSISFLLGPFSSCEPCMPLGMFFQ